jgi:hypothetical protein
MLNKKIAGITICLILITTTISFRAENENHSKNISDKKNKYQHSPISDPDEQLDQSQTIWNMNTFVIKESTKAQSFVPQIRYLTRVELYMSRFGDIDTDVVVSIRNLKDGADLTSVSKKASELPTNNEWVDFDFNDITVTPWNTYYIVCRTDGGNLDNCYVLGMSDHDAYLEGDAWEYGFFTNYVWEIIDSYYGIPYDLCFKTYGVDNHLPDKPGIPNGPVLTLVGKNYIYSFSTTDPDGDKFRFELDHGDGTSSWTSKYVEAGDRIGVSWNRAGTYEVRVRAEDEYGGRSPWSDVITVEVAELDIIGVEAIQVMSNVSLINGKGTIFRVRVRSDFSASIDAYFCLKLPNTEWYYIPPLPDVTIRVPGYWRFPSLWGPITLHPGMNSDIILPIVPSGNEEDLFDPDDNVTGLITGVVGPDARVVPRPWNDPASFEVIVDPNPEYACSEDQEDYNVYSGSCKVVTTKPMHIHFVPFTYNFVCSQNDTLSSYEYYLNERGYDDIAARLTNVQNTIVRGTVLLTTAVNNSEIGRLHREAKRYISYALGTYPFNDSKISYSFDNTLYFREDWLIANNYNPCHQWFFEIDINTMLKNANPQIDQIVFIQLFDLGGQSTGSGGVYVDAGIELIELGHQPWYHRLHDPSITDSQDKRYFCLEWNYSYGGAGESNLAHEFTHQFLGAPDCYICPEDPEHMDCGSCYLDEYGYWVNKWRSYSKGTRYFMWDVCSGYCRDWNRKNPTFKNDSITPFPDGYLNAIDYFQSVLDPDVILIRGKISENDEAIFDSFFQLFHATVDMRIQDTGDYFFVLKDLQGNTLGKYGFKGVFIRYPPSPCKPEPVEEIYLNYKVEWKDGTRKIELQDENRKVLATKMVTINKPEIKIISPNGGETFKKGKSIKLEWTASDSDGDLLSYIILYSPDDGEKWHPVALNTNCNEYMLDTNILGTGEDFRIMVKATDGVNTESDTSDGSFSISKNKDLVKTRYFINQILEHFSIFFQRLKIF